MMKRRTTGEATLTAGPALMVFAGIFNTWSAASVASNYDLTNSALPRGASKTLMPRFSGDDSKRPNRTSA